DFADVLLLSEGRRGEKSGENDGYLAHSEDSKGAAGADRVPVVDAAVPLARRRGAHHRTARVDLAAGARPPAAGTPRDGARAADVGAGRAAVSMEICRPLPEEPSPRDAASRRLSCDPL